VTQVAILRHGDKSWALFPGSPLIVGSGENCDLQLPIHGVAKKHFKIALLSDGSLHVKPLGSHRVEVEGARIESGTILPEGSSLVFGLAHLETHGEKASFSLHLREAFKKNLKTAQQEIHKLPWLLSSLAIHIFLVWLLLTLKAPTPQMEGETAKFGMEKVTELSTEEQRDNHEESIQLPQIKDPTPPPVSSNLPILSDLEPKSQSQDSLGTGGSADELENGRELFSSLFSSKNQSRGKSFSGLSGALKRRISHLRRTGLEIALCIDSTSSMGETINRAKGNLKTIFLLLKDLVPGIRIALITYRDKGDAYVIRKTRLGVKLWEGLSFLSSVEAEGGGDFPEAVDEALAQANRLPWKRSATKVILLVGDAPPHPYIGLSRSMRIAKIFSNRRGSVHAMQVGKDPATTQAFAKISKAGKGLRILLGSEGSIDSFARLFLQLALGPVSKKDVPRMLAQWKKKHLSFWKFHLGKGKRSSGPLINTLRSPRPNQEIIETWAQRGTRAELRRLLPTLRRKHLSVEGRQALIYLANSLFDREGLAPVRIKKTTDQWEILSKIKAQLNR